MTDWKKAHDDLRERVEDYAALLDQMDDGGTIVWRSGLEVPFSDLRTGLRALLATPAPGTGEEVGTGAGEGAPGQDTGSAWVTRSADCPEAPAQAHHLATPAPEVAREVTLVEPGCTCGGMAACWQCQSRDAAAPDLPTTAPEAARLSPADEVSLPPKSPQSPAPEAAREDASRAMSNDLRCDDCGGRHGPEPTCADHGLSVAGLADLWEHEAASGRESLDAARTLRDCADALLTHLRRAPLPAEHEGDHTPAPGLPTTGPADQDAAPTVLPPSPTLGVDRDAGQVRLSEKDLKHLRWLVDHGQPPSFGHAVVRSLLDALAARQSADTEALAKVEELCAGWMHDGPDDAALHLFIKRVREAMGRTVTTGEWTPVEPDGGA